MYTPCGSEAETVLDKTSKLTEEARGSFPAIRLRFLAGLPQGSALFVRTTIRDGGVEESVFLAVDRIEDGQVLGTLSSDITRLASWNYGDPFGVSEDEIEDWVILNPDGSEEGNIIGKWIEAFHAECP